MDTMVPNWLRGPGAIRLVAQPLVDLARCEVAGYEVLARFPESGLPPYQVFAQATEAGFGADIEAMVIRSALELKCSLPKNVFISINVDPHHLRSPVVRDVLHEIDLTKIVFELTEHRHFGDLNDLLFVLANLRRRGATVAVDDAGSGYAGLQQLLAIRPQLIKLDRALISGLDRDEAKRALVSMLGDFASRLDAWILGEGIETEGELRALREIGVPLGQGYFLGRPADPWSSLRQEAAQVLQDFPHSHRRTSLLAFLDPTPTLGSADPWPTGDAASMRLDDYGRPFELKLEGQRHQTRGGHEMLWVNVTENPRSAIQRALVRPSSRRWDPMVIVDDAGTFLGLARLDRIMCGLLETYDTPPSSLAAPDMTGS